MLIVSIISATFGAAFLVWGIYQIKTNKMVAKRTRSTVDDPRQVGILFIAISIIAFWFTAIFIARYLSTSSITAETTAQNPILPELLGIGLGLFSSIFAICISVYGLKNHRIFGIKNTPKIAKYTRKSYILVNSSLLLCIFSSLILLFFHQTLLPHPSSSLFVNLILICIIFVFITIIATTMARIEQKIHEKYLPHQKMTPKSL